MVLGAPPVFVGFLEGFADALASALLLALVCAWWRIAPGLREDVDRFFHYALSREMMNQGFVVRFLPQLKFLGWHEYFSDTHFLFNFFTALGWKAAGEAGVNAVAFGFACGSIALIYAVARCFTGTLASFLAVLFGAFANPLFLYRLAMIRAHLFAIFCLMLLLLAILRRWPRLAFAATLAFALGYHALYIPLFLTLLALLVAFVSGPGTFRSVRSVAVASFGGLVCGILLYPYFPSNLHDFLQGFTIPFRLGRPGLLVGGELYPLSAVTFLKWMSQGALWLAFSTALLVPEWKRRRGWLDAIGFEGLLLLSVAASFFVLLLLSPRMVEYYVPCLVVALAWLASRVGEKKFLAIGCVLAVAQGFTLFPYLRDQAEGAHVDARTESARAALAQIPAGELVFNCNWGLGSYILYFRPDLRFIDLLEPHILYARAPLLAYSKNTLFLAQIRDPAREIRAVFGSSWVLCDSTGLNLQLSLDPNAERLTPAATQVQLFRLRERSQENWVRALAEDAAQGARPETIPLVDPGALYFDWWDGKSGAHCRDFTLPASEAQRFRGKTWIGISGGRVESLAWNGIELVRGERQPVHPKGWPLRFFIEGWVRLPRAFRDADKVSLRVCPEESQQEFGLGLSFWSDAEQEDFRRRLAAGWSYAP